MIFGLGLEFEVLGLRFQDWGFTFLGLVFSAWTLDIVISSLWFRFWDFDFEVCVLEFRVRDLYFQVLDFRFAV